MKKGVWFISILPALILFSFISLHAQTDSDSPPGPPDMPSDTDINKIQGVTDQIPLNEQGEFDPNKLPLSKAEQRVQAINEWLDNNASWLKWIFGMTPEISFLFGINFLIILFFINFLFLNSDYNIIAILPFSSSVSKILGIFLLILIIIGKVTVKIATFFDGLVGIWWIKVIICFCFVIAIIISNLMFSKIKEFKKKQKELEAEFNMQRIKDSAELAEGLTKQ